MAFKSSNLNNYVFIVYIKSFQAMTRHCNSSNLALKHDSTRITRLIMDKERRVIRFAKVTTRLFNQINSDVGRPLEHISDNFDDEDLFVKAVQVLKNLIPIEEDPSQNKILLATEDVTERH